MAQAASAVSSDPLILLRHAVAASQTPIPTTSATAPEPESEPAPLSHATHLFFPEKPDIAPIPLSTPTRFLSNDTPIDFRSILFAYQSKDLAIADYIAATQRLNDELAAPDAAGGVVRNLVFVEKLDLIGWLEGGDGSEFIQPLEGEADAAAGDAAARDAGQGLADGAVKERRRGDSAIDSWGERRMSDRNIILRGIKPTDFSHIRKTAATFLAHARHSSRPGASHSGGPSAANGALVSNLKRPNRRPEPIILLSPSASSLLRISNIKSFLESGTYVPPDTGSSTANILHISRPMPSLDTNRPLRFILVDGPDRFKPDDWNRVVAVFTTGQTWQFKSYKWTNPADLFSHCMGIYVGWQGEEVPSTVRGWGRRVVSVGVDKYSGAHGGAGRWRDREVVEGIWGAIEESMRTKGWGRDGPMGGR